MVSPLQPNPHLLSFNIKGKNQEQHAIHYVSSKSYLVPGACTAALKATGQGVCWVVAEVVCVSSHSSGISANGCKMKIEAHAALWNE